LTVAGLNPQQQIECIIEVSLIFHRVGLQKKFAFFLFVAALLSAESNNFGFAHSLVRFYFILFET
jgi:hypothetical protein